MKALALLFLIALTACTARVPSALIGTYTVMCQDSEPLDPTDRFEYPCCSAFAFEGRIVTAAHCVEYVGQDIRVVSAQQWVQTSNGGDTTRVASMDPERDFAVLGPVSGGLSLGPQVALTAELSALTAELSALTRKGVLHGYAYESSGRFYMTDLDVIRGDSGSPVVDSSGHVVGMVLECLANSEGSQCVPHSGVIAGLE